MKLRTSHSNGPTIVTAILSLSVAYVCYLDGEDGHERSGYVWIGLILGTLIGLLTTIWALWGGEFLVVDIPGAMAEFRSRFGDKPVSLPLASLGDLHIEVIKDRNRGKGDKMDRYILRAPGLPNMELYDTFKRARVEARKTLIEHLVAAAAIRPILEVAHGEGAAFRAGPDVLPRARELVPDVARLRGGCEALANDSDRHVRDNASALRTALDSGSV